MPRFPRLTGMTLALALALLVAPGAAPAQECVSCWTEKCPDLKGYTKACPAAKRDPAASSPVAPAKAAGPCPAGMAFLPGGSFKMGKRGDEVNVRAYCLDVTEVTVKTFAACARVGECRPAYDTVDWPSISEAARTKLSGNCNVERADRADHPVTCITWNQAVSYCEWKGKRLPTEEEWEWAARGGARGSLYPWGDREPMRQLCWDGEGNDLGKGNRQSTCRVGSYPSGDSPQGVKDLAGNVWEWTASEDAESSRVGRGGAWDDGYPTFVSASNRSGFSQTFRNDLLGFRCAKTP